MPRFEVSVILRVLKRTETVETMKNLVSHVLKNGNVVRGIQCLGSRGLPVLKKKSGVKYTEGTYFLIDMHCPLDQIDSIQKHFTVDENVISAYPVRHDVAYTEPPPCGGMDEPDYGKLLENLEKSGKYVPRPKTHPYVP